MSKKNEFEKELIEKLKPCFDKLQDEIEDIESESISESKERIAREIKEMEESEDENKRYTEYEIEKLSEARNTSYEIEQEQGYKFECPECGFEVVQFISDGYYKGDIVCRDCYVLLEEKEN